MLHSPPKAKVLSGWVVYNFAHWRAHRLDMFKVHVLLHQYDVLSFSAIKYFRLTKMGQNEERRAIHVDFATKRTSSTGAKRIP